MAINFQNSAYNATESGKKNYSVGLYALMTLFFMMGFITCLNDILIPYLKAIFNLSYTQANFINLCFFGAYFIMSIPSGLIIQKVGYKGGMIIGFITAAVGCFLFYPAASAKIYGLFLAALFILATGITLLQVAGNPYVTALGKPESASARLTLTQAFNSLGTTLAPFFGALFILSNLPNDLSYAGNIDIKALQVPYVFLGLALLFIAIVVFMLKLPKVGSEPGTDNIASDITEKGSIWQYKHLILGAAGIFFYVGAEVAIGSHIVNFLQLPNIMSFTAEEAGKYVSYYWGGAMVGRFIGSIILKKFNPGSVLAFNAVTAIVLLLIAIFTYGGLAMWALLAVGLMNSLMFATIFTLAVKNLGKYTNQASGILCTAIVGGALIPLFYGALSDFIGLQLALFIPLLCYVFIGYYGLKGNNAK